MMAVEPLGGAGPNREVAHLATGERRPAQHRAVKTDANPAELPKNGDKVDEGTGVGEIGDVEPGSTKKATFKLATGKYAMVCALPGHYEGGMYGSLTVE